MTTKNTRSEKTKSICQSLQMSRRNY